MIATSQDSIPLPLFENHDLKGVGVLVAIEPLAAFHSKP